MGSPERGLTSLVVVAAESGAAGVPDLLKSAKKKGAPALGGDPRAFRTPYND
jgi:hypothetical protein